MTKRGVGPACRPYLSATRHAGPAGASCTAFDPSSYIRRRGCFFLCQGRHSRGSTTASCTSRPPRTRTTARVLDGEHGRLAVPLWQQRARGAAQRSTCTRPRSTVLIITARVDTARGLLESEWRSHGGLLPKKNSRCRKQQRHFSCGVRWSGFHLCSAHRAHHVPRCIRSCAAAVLAVLRRVTLAE